ncbi:unnamed protein product [Paramecium octaurelia]|uniref:Uncharacterized protein n=1 Tax=Paramecium octaurelia TaxID=43137 RepID=A0A8S1V9F5_PAROT|nr:unnamed protein product [Paramecium octaurelia]CAD8171556.1 unnamed protein product [Paramecium octaurelia]
MYCEQNSKNEFLSLNYHINNKFELENYLIENFTEQLNFCQKGSQQQKDGSQKTFIGQQYITNPLQYTKENLIFNHTFYRDQSPIERILVLRWLHQTSSKEFNRNNLSNKMIHLTNDERKEYGIFWRIQDLLQNSTIFKNRIQEIQQSVWSQNQLYNQKQFNQVYERMKYIALEYFKVVAELLGQLKEKIQKIHLNYLAQIS